MSVCIRGHTERALKHGATQQEVLEAIWVAAEMRAGAAYAHANLALETMNHWSGPVRRLNVVSAPPDFPTALYHAFHHRLVPGADALSPA
jgi:Carboxymuconolactone decarboxylase family